MNRLLLLVPVLWLTACASLGTAVVTITDVVDSAVKSWAYLSAHGQTSKETDLAVIKAHDKYREAAAVAQAALVAYKASGNQGDYVRALEAAKAGAQPLIDLIASVVTPVKAVELKTKLAKASKP